MAVGGTFLAGVVEGFYGQPWSEGERAELFQWMGDWGLNTYLYAPKDDLKHRALWREEYSSEEASRLRDLIRRAAQREIRFIYALAPGLDIRYCRASDIDRILTRFNQMLSLGCRDFALLFDDIPPVMSAEDQLEFSSFAAAQASVANRVFHWTRQRSPDCRFLFCPTPYCGRMAQRQLGGANYLPTLGADLLPDIDVLWTGPEIISRSIGLSDLPLDLLRRKPVIWDNLHANDYDRSRCYCGPYAGRDPEIRWKINGILSNPNNEFPVNYVPLRTLAMFVQTEVGWNPRAAFLDAIEEWQPRFRVAGGALPLESLCAFADAFYLPHELGEAAEGLLAAARELILTGKPEALAAFRAGAKHVREFCHRAPDLDDRRLFYALAQRVWDLREELDLVERYIEWRQNPATASQPFRSDFHLPGTYRGGAVRRLQSLLRPLPDGTFEPNWTA